MSDDVTIVHRRARQRPEAIEVKDESTKAIACACCGRRCSLAHDRGDALVCMDCTQTCDAGRSPRHRERS